MHTYMKKVLLAAALFSGISIVSISSALTPVQSGGGDPSPGILSPICWTYGATQCSHPVSTRGCLVGIFVDLTDYVNTLGYTTHYVWACENAGLTTLCSVPKASSCASDADITLKTSYACGDTAFKVTASMYPMDELKNVSVTIKGTNVSTKETFTKTIGVHKTTGEGFASLVYDNKASNHYIGRGTFDLTVTASYNGQAVSVHDKNGDLVSSLTIDDLYMSDDCTDTVIIPGCMDASATNFNPNANEDNKSCLYVDPVAGCTDPLATNYNRNATRDDGSCTLQTTDVVVQRPDI